MPAFFASLRTPLQTTCKLAFDTYAIAGITPASFQWLHICVDLANGWLPTYIHAAGGADYLHSYGWSWDHQQPPAKVGQIQPS